MKRTARKPVKGTQNLGDLFKGRGLCRDKLRAVEGVKKKNIQSCLTGNTANG